MKKAKLIIIISLLMIPTISFMISTNFKRNSVDLNDNDNKCEEINLKRAYFNNSMEMIFIDDSQTGVGAHNWTWAESKPWCTGEGTSDVPYLIANLTINAGGASAGIEIRNSNVFFQIRNCTIYDASKSEGLLGSGIKWIDVKNGTLFNNSIFDNMYGINLESNCENNTISENRVYNNPMDGLYLYNSWDNTFTNNEFYNNTMDGLILDNSWDNTITNNEFYNNSNYGIQLWTNCHHNTIRENKIYNNSYKGITLELNCDFNTIYDNKIYDNTYHGIFLKDDCHNNTIEDNEIENHSSGLILSNNCDINIITGNTFQDCSSNGVAINNNNNYNSIYNNQFIDNPIFNAYDNGTGNEWNKGTLGNFWDDYTGQDANDDGIGDTPYIIDDGDSGSQDNYPIWEDGDDVVPTLLINSPAEGTIFGSAAPTFNLSIFDINLNLGWYTVEGNATKNFFSVINGINSITMNLFIWNGLPEGDIIIRFFVNDSAGNSNSLMVTINKQLPSDGGGIPFGNFYLLIIGISIVSLVIIWRSKIKLK